MSALKPSFITRIARLMCWVLLLLPVIQTTALAHELGHLNRIMASKTVVTENGAAPLASNKVCDSCLAFAALAGGCAPESATKPITLPLEPHIWQSTPPPHFVARSIPAYASRAPPSVLV
ncbi:MAG: hypothetical protein FWD62_04410 [Betaproteobacteria bacterium]|nr:hypothetical protein [Betaproteobacteria bacterium]